MARHLRSRASWHIPLRVLALLLLLIAPAILSGCFGPEPESGERLATEVSSPVVIPATGKAQQPVFNTSDPGYRIDGLWRVGDGWDYESNQSHVRHVRVVDSRFTAGTMRYLVETRESTVNVTGERVSRAWIDSRGWLMVNQSEEKNAYRYTPGVAQRFWKNATFGYEREQLDATGRTVSRDNVTVFSRLFPFHQTLRFPWGYVEAKKVEHLETVRVEGGGRTQSTTSYWVHRDYLAPVQLQLPSGETYTLTAAQNGDFRRGILDP